MADDGNIITDLNLGGNGNGDDQTPTAGIVMQYVKDLSVENPSAPESFQWQETPGLDVQFNIGAKPVSEELHEVELRMTATAKTSQGVSYAVELSYCGVIGMRNLDEANAHAFLYAEAPRILFPFARRIVADAVRDAGFPPLMLDPVDFNALYVQQLQAQQNQGGDDTPPVPTGNA
ncbi:protein-export protein SecB [Novosphingobium marinum]|uniref:Protein-export protein SecB n=1 Tax=Novosphingobium marinum TaxID=1514948 RepID=A0A7Z0BVC1_9SPHN|nr:protein-export chaperone SecB [Novosphingobium marinum]NYH95077.1 preprotein translocase subunit SecB [Novosphingobium marinum]GGC24076.1 protein-export protein SecB [Novosphingobium marinum]